MTQLSALPTSIANLESTIAQLQQSQAPKSGNPQLSMPLQPTLQLLNEREEHLMDLDQQIEALRASLPHKRDEIVNLQDQVSILNTRKIKAVEEAKEARRRRENGGMGDELDERGRWLRGVESALRSMLEV